MGGGDSNGAGHPAPVTYSSPNVVSRSQLAAIRLAGYYSAVVRLMFAALVAGALIWLIFRRYKAAFTLGDWLAPSTLRRPYVHGRKPLHNS
jgi:hypothetical protein